MLRAELDGVVAQLVERPRPGHDEDGRDVAQLGAHRSGVLSLAANAAGLALGAGAKDHRIVRAVRSRHVDDIDVVVGAEAGADLGVAVDEGEGCVAAGHRASLSAAAWHPTRQHT